MWFPHIPSCTSLSTYSVSFPEMHLRMGVKKPRFYKLPLWLVNLADLVLILAASFGSSGRRPSIMYSQMGSIQLGSDSTGATSTSHRSIEGSARYSIGVDLLRSSCEANASFAVLCSGDMSDLDNREPLQ